MKISATVTLIMLCIGSISGILSFLTFQDRDIRKVGCGVYLRATALTSIFTIGMFTVKFWFLVLTRVNLLTSISVIRGGCVFIEPFLKLFLYMNAWLNACVAVERAILVFQGVTFNKKKSKRMARLIVTILPICIMGSIIHELFYRQLFELKTEIDKTEISNWCITLYPRSLQYYNTVILFVHLVGPFIINLLSALFIVFGSAWHRSIVQTGKTYKGHVYHQLQEQKQLLISPIILLILSFPSLTMALLSECVNTSHHPVLFLSGYFISFIPSMLIFIIFVLPSNLYRKKFGDSLKRWRRRIHQ